MFHVGRKERRLGGTKFAIASDLMETEPIRRDDEFEQNQDYH